MRSTEARIYYRPPTGLERYLPEGPQLVRMGGREVLAWVNIQSGADSRSGSIFWMDPASPDTVHHVPCRLRPGFFRPLATGERLLVGCDKDLYLCDLSSGEWSGPLATIPDDSPRTIINDGAVVPGGKAIVFGTKDIQFKDSIAGLYLYTIDDNRVSPLVDRQTCSNGKVFATNERGLLLLDIDTPTKTVARYRLDIAKRTATPDGVALDLSNQVGFPDGMCDCGDGTVIIAFYNPDFSEAGRAVRFNHTTGQAIEEWTTPGSPRVTCPLLMKQPDGVKLILTTATEGMAPELQARCPNAGCLFIADTSLATCPDPQIVRM